MFSAFSMTARSARLRSTYWPIGSAREAASCATSSSKTPSSPRTSSITPCTSRSAAIGTASAPCSPSAPAARARAPPSDARSATVAVSPPAHTRPGSSSRRSSASARDAATSSSPQPASACQAAAQRSSRPARVLAPQQRDAGAESLAERLEAARQRLVERRRLAEHPRDLALDRQSPLGAQPLVQVAPRRGRRAPELHDRATHDEPGQARDRNPDADVPRLAGRVCRLADHQERQPECHAHARHDDYQLPARAVQRDPYDRQQRERREP